MLCCSTAAGPAFEGVGIHMGMLAARNAVSSVKYADGKFKIEVLDGTAESAVGICGSGIVSAVAALLAAGLIDETGLLEGNAAYNNQPAFILPGTSVLITQKDIRAVQLAKSAICAGILTLLKEADLSAGEIDEVLIAGGFGNAVCVLSAERISLIPAGFKNKQTIGNAAGAGAVKVLLDSEARRETAEIAKNAETVDLSTNPFFMEQYVENMMFET
jgi:uncharacterized 2Fe-2S/4Fe-4S cluster protein (DUF4445 family)